MNFFAILLLLITGAGLCLGSRKVAMASFIVGCCYMTAGEGVMIAGFNFPIFRILLIVGVARMLMVGGGWAGGINRVDRHVVIWGVWMLFSSLFHEQLPGSGLKYMTGAVFNMAGFYFMVRYLCQDSEDVEALFGTLCWVLAPVAAMMVVEQAIQYNIFSVFGGVPEAPALRNGRFRAQGPFNHAILAGTVGAGCLPLVLSTWTRNKVRAMVGAVSCLLMVVACASSGPIMTVIFAMIGLVLWWRKPVVRFLVKAAIPLYLFLALVMERPPYYLISKIDLTGASTGWHRSFLIDQWLNHFQEWWLFGTDRTVHWMPSQGKISENHTDITNQYISYAVNGGLISMLLLILMMGSTFRTVGRLQSVKVFSINQKLAFWAFGASLFAHAASGMSVAYFGQAQFFFWLPIACLASFHDYGRGRDREGSLDDRLETGDGEMQYRGYAATES